MLMRARILAILCIMLVPSGSLTFAQGLGQGVIPVGPGQDAGSGPNIMVPYGLSISVRDRQGADFSKDPPRVGVVLRADFSIENDTNQPITMRELQAGGRGPGGANLDWNTAPDASFPAENDVTVEPGGYYDYYETMSFSQPGHYFAEPVWQDSSGTWHGIPDYTNGDNNPRYDRVYFDVVGTAPPPPPAHPTPTTVPPPSNQIPTIQISDVSWLTAPAAYLPATLRITGKTTGFPSGSDYLVNLLVYVSRLQDPINLWYKAADPSSSPYISPSKLPNGTFTIEISDIQLPRLLSTRFAVQVFSTTDLRAQDARPNEQVEVGPSDQQYRACWLSLYEVGTSALKLPTSLVNPELLDNAVQATQVTLRTLTAIDAADKCGGVQSCLDDTRSSWTRDLWLTLPDEVAGKLGPAGFIAVLAKNAIVALPELGSCAEYLVDQQIEQTKETIAGTWDAAYKLGSIISSLVVKSPAYPLLVDSEGRRAGFLPDGTLVQEIPDSIVEDIGDKHVVMVPGNAQATLSGYAQGTMTVYALLPVGTGGDAVSADYTNVPVSQGMSVSINSSDGQGTLNIDSNGDGTVDQTQAPSRLDRVNIIGGGSSTNSYSFAQTGFQVSGRFWDVWQSGQPFNDSLYINGLPITDMHPEINVTDGKTYQTQWFERARFELHPENQAPDDVLLGLLGTDATAGRTSESAFQAVPNPGGDIPWFRETGHTLGDDSEGGKAIAAYWNQYGNLKQFGFPLSQPFYEYNSADGHTYLVQYFERQRFEYHPENKGTRYEVLLGLLGVEQYHASYFGPTSGQLLHTSVKDQYLARAGVRTRDFQSTVKFYSPFDAKTHSWDVAMQFRTSGANLCEVIVSATAQGTYWAADCYEGSAHSYPLGTGSLSNWDSSASGANTISIAAQGSTGAVSVNGKHIADFDLSGAMLPGDIVILTGRFSADWVPGAITRFDNFAVRPVSP